MQEIQKTRDVMSALPYLVCLGICLSLAATSSAAAQEGHLTLAQVETLIRVHAPEEVIHEQIRKRGLGFDVTPAVMEQVEKMGASGSLLAQLRAEIRAGSIEVHTLPLSTLIIDGKQVGNANDQGIFVAKDVSEGNHTIAASSPDYKDASTSVRVANHETKRVEISLRWQGGYLTVVTIPVDAKVEVTGPQSFNGQINNTACAAGDYTIRVSHVGMETETRTVTVSSEEINTARIRLTADPRYLSQRIAVAQERLKENDRVNAFKIAASVHEMDTKNLDALTIMARTSFELGEPQAFLTFARAVIRGGGTVTLPLKHVHVSPGSKLHDVSVSISSAGLVMLQQPVQFDCKLDDSLISSATMGEARIVQNMRRPPYLRISYSTSQGENATDQKETNADFALNGSVVERPNSRELMDSVVELLNEVRARP